MELNAKTSRSRAQRVRLGLTLLGLISLTSWLAVIAFSLEPYPWFRPWTFTSELATCFALGAVARTLAFRVFKRVRIALDSALYVAVAFIWGAVPAAWLILVIITGDAIIRTMRESGPGDRATRLRQSARDLAQSGSLPALVLLFLAAVFGLDRGQPYSDLAIVVMLPAFSLSFLIVHYLLAGGSHWFQGERSYSLLRSFFLRVVVAELTLVPLSLAMVLDYLHYGFLFFLILGCTALLFNWLFRRASITSEKLDERVSELATINNVGRILSSSLERRALITNIASETVRLVGSASRFVIGSYDSRHENIVVDVFLRGDAREVERRTTRGSSPRIEPVQRAIVPRGYGLAGWVMQNRRPLLLTDVPAQCAAYVTNPEEIPRCASWLGVPLIIYDEVIGVMAVESDAGHAYNADHLRVLTIIADHAAVALENARLYELATVDGLTGLFVRRYFDQRLTEEWRRAIRYGQEFALAILDLDHFKKLNDTYGHQAGDQVLRGAASILRDSMRGADLAGRYGGEEFAFILPRTTVGEARVMAERIRKDIEAMYIEVNGEGLQVTCSIGVAGYPECRAEDSAALLAFADQALYDAKAQGRNRVVAAPHTELVPKFGHDGREDPSQAITLEMTKPNVRA